MCVAWLRWNDTEAVRSSFSVEVIHGPGVEEQHMWFSAQVHQICLIQSNSLFPSSIIQVSTTLMHYLLALACCLINYLCHTKLSVSAPAWGFSAFPRPTWLSQCPGEATVSLHSKKYWVSIQLKIWTNPAVGLNFYITFLTQKLG